MKKTTRKPAKKAAATKNPIRKRGAKSRPGKSAARGIKQVEAELGRSLGLTMKQAVSIFRRGGDAAERKFMECCWCLWKANGSELIEVFIEAAFDVLPVKSRRILFERMLTIVYVAQDSAVKQIKSQ
jgi:hypothetical protein